MKPRNFQRGSAKPYPISYLPCWNGAKRAPTFCKRLKLHPDDHLEEYFADLEVIDLMSPNKTTENENSNTDGNGYENEDYVIQRRKKVKANDYMLFSPDALRYITAGSASHEKYTWLGERLRLTFKMLRSDSRLVRTTLHSHGFMQCSSKNPKVNVIWSGGAMKSVKMKDLMPWQRLNQFPRSTELTKKDRMYENLDRAKSIFGNAFDFMPESCVTPRELQKMAKLCDQLESEIELGITNPNYPGEFIVKPTNSRQGKGIFFANKLEDIPLDSTFLVSRYISNPYLVNKHKFDLRIYVAVTSFYPLVCYVYSEGLTRLASMPYDSTSSSSESSEYIHLTNYSINKNSTSFVRNESMSSEDLGHKWTLGALLRYVENDGKDAKLLMLRIEDMIIKSLLSIQNLVATSSRHMLKFVGTNFELFGFDVLVDQDLKPWLLEVNLSPSLACDAPLDSLIKTRLFADLMNLACVPLLDRKIIESVTPAIRSSIQTENGGEKTEDDDADQLELDPACAKILKKRPVGIRRTILNKRYANGSSLLTPNEQKLDQISRKVKIENERRGDFVRVFPRVNSWDLYNVVMEDIGNEDFDQRLYGEIFPKENQKTERNNGISRQNERNLLDDNDDVADLFHEVMINCAKYKTFNSIPSDVRKMIEPWYKEAGEYTKKITVEGNVYASKLPAIRASARLRTKSCAEYYEVKRTQLAKKKEQEALLRSEMENSNASV